MINPNNGFPFVSPHQNRPKILPFSLVKSNSNPHKKPFDRHEAQRKANITKANKDWKRFFYPQEYLSFINNIRHEDTRFYFEFLLHTGMRIKEARGVQVRDIDLDRESITIKKAKRGKQFQRTIQISTYLKNRIQNWIRIKKLGALDYLGIPTVQVMDRQAKKWAQEANIGDYSNFSCHTFRKTLENWLVGLNVNVLAIQSHMGHTLDVAAAYYVSTNLFKGEEKVLMQTILGNLFQK